MSNRANAQLRNLSRFTLLLQGLPTFRTTVGYLPTVRASLGGASFVDDLKNHACVIALIFQHGFQHSPASIQNRFRKFGFDHCLAGYVANEDCRILIHELAAVLMERILPSVFDFGMNCFDSFLVPGSLGYTQLCFKSPVFATLNTVAIGVGRRLFAAQVNAD